MKGLLCKDFYSLCNPVGYLVPALLLLAGVILKMPYLLSFIAVYLGALPIGMLQNDEISRWDIRLMTMPFSRRTIVAEKYLFSLLLALIAALLIGCGVLFCGSAVFPDRASAAAWLTGALMPCIMMPVLCYPFSFRFGARKANMLFMVLIILFAGVFSASISFPDAVFVPLYYPIIALIKFFPGVRADASAVAELNKVLELEKSRIILYTLAGYAILTILSWLLANRGFRKRSF